VCAAYRAGWSAWRDWGLRFASVDVARAPLAGYLARGRRDRRSTPARRSRSRSINPTARARASPLGGDPERDDIRAAPEIDPIDHQHPQLIPGPRQERPRTPPTSTPTAPAPRPARALGPHDRLDLELEGLVRTRSRSQPDRTRREDRHLKVPRAPGQPLEQGVETTIPA
jgi:hypothetical protein